MTETVTGPLVVTPGETKVGFAGTSVPRKEDKRLVQGEGVFFDDVKRHGMGYVHFVRSPYAHAKILSIDVSKALELGGVYGTLTGEEVAILTDPFFELSVKPGADIKDYALAVHRVRHVGEPVAAVVASSRELARDAAELVEVEYEPLPVSRRESRHENEDPPRRRRLNVVAGASRPGRLRGAVAEADPCRDRAPALRPLLDVRRMRGRPRRVNRGTGQWMYGNRQMPDRRDRWRRRCSIDKRASSPRTSAARSATVCLHPQYVACCLLARKLNRGAVDGWRTDQHTGQTHGNSAPFSTSRCP
jgi:2-furoyl-CoA dehydrogenase large subunit